MNRAMAVNAFIRGLMQSLVVTVAVAVWQAVRDGIDVSGPVDWGHVQRVAINAAAIAILGALVRLVQTGRLERVSWQVDSWIRSGRTLIVGLAITLAAAAVQAIQSAVSNGTYDPEALVKTALVAAGMAFTAWVHRLVVDPSPIPSAVPPVSGEPVTGETRTV
jgi:hypothetical protein